MGLPRTTNSCEAWHNRWDNLVSGGHIGTYKLIQNIIEEDDRSQGIIEEVNSGVVRPTLSRKSRIKSAQLQTVLEN